MAKIKTYKCVTDGDFRFISYELPRYFEVHISDCDRPFFCFRYKKSCVSNHDDAIMYAHFDMFMNSNL